MASLSETRNLKYESPIGISFPIIKSDNFGHIDKKIIIPIGTKAKIDTKDKTKIKLLESCVC